MSRPWLVVIGSSTGAPPVLLEILSALPPLPCPLVIAHHILPGFEAGLATYLGTSGHAVTLVRTPTLMQPGQVYLAPGDKHLVVKQDRLALRAPAGERFTPSVDRLFLSAAETDYRLVAAILTGMGRDGAEGLLAIRRAGGATVTQSAETCTVDGMPAAARNRGASSEERPPAGIAAFIRETVQGRPPMSAREKLLKLING